VLVKEEQINDYLFSDTIKRSNKMRNTVDESIIIPVYSQVRTTYACQCDVVEARVIQGAKDWRKRSDLSSLMNASDT
jgi:hypothetical protein